MRNISLTLSNQINVGVTLTDARLTVLQFIGDTHFGVVTASRPQQIIDDAVITPLACIQTGDIIDTNAGEDAAALAWLAALPATAYPVLGGHDIYGNFRTPAQWAAVYGVADKNYTVDFGPLVLIVLGPDTATTTLAAATITYLDTQLGATAKPCIIACHAPIYNSVRTADPTNYFDSVQTSFYTQDFAAVWAVLAAHDNAKAWVSGHTHNLWSDTGFVKSVQCGTHHMALINTSSPYYTNKTTGENLSEIVVSVYMTVGTSLRVSVRDHTNKSWIKSWLVPLSTGETEITTLLDEQFATATPAPLDLTVANPGPGGLDFLDANSVMSVTGGKLVINGTPGAGNGFWVQDVVLRSEGYAFCFDVPDRTTTAVTSIYIGLGTARNESTIADIGFGITSTTTIGPRSGAASLGFSHTVGSGAWSFKCVMRSSGGFILARDSGDTASQWKIVYIYSTKTSALYAKMRLTTDAVNFTLDNLFVGKLSGIAATDWGMVTARKAVSVDGDTITETADSWVEHTITAQTGVTQEIMFHWGADSDTWICRLDQTNSLIKLITRTGGVETERDSDAQTWTNGAQYCVRIYHSGSTVRTYVDDVNKNAVAVTFQNATTGVKVSHAGANLASWPLSVTL